LGGGNPDENLCKRQDENLGGPLDDMLGGPPVPTARHSYSKISSLQQTGLVDIYNSLGWNHGRWHPTCWRPDSMFLFSCSSCIRFDSYLCCDDCSSRRYFGH
jgi:hypothetical protein